jgi:hypothetical protein
LFYGFLQYGKYDDKYGKYDDKYGKYDDKYGKYDDKYGKYDDKVSVLSACGFLAYIGLSSHWFAYAMTMPT